MITRGAIIKALADKKSGAHPEGKTMAQSVKPFVAAAAVVATGTLLVVAIFFTLLDLQWVAFLTGVMFAAILAMVTQATLAERKAASRGERLGMVEYQLEKETADRERLEAMLAAANSRLQYFDTSSPVMLAFVDATTRYAYHNHALRHWLGLAAANIDGHHMRDVLGRKVFAEVEPYVLQVADGHTLRYERTHKALDGSLYQMAVQFLPRYSHDGEYTGFFVVMTGVSGAADPGTTPAGADEPPQTGGARTALPVAGSAADTALSRQSAAAIASAWEEATRRILAAINGNEFTLFCQSIRPLANSNTVADHYEILIRLLEEESSMIPPGAFFPLAEEHGLLPQLDRWVFSHVLEWIATPTGTETARSGSIYFVKIEAATISDPDFPDFIAHELQRTGAPAASVCFQIDEPVLMTHQGDAVHFARTVKESGCRVAISGFGRDRGSVAALKLFQVDFLKIDGSIVRQMATYPALHTKAAALSRLANTIGVPLVAEMVEDDATLSMLRDMKVDFAQGFGISRPKQLVELQGRIGPR